MCTHTTVFFAVSPPPFLPSSSNPHPTKKKDCQTRYTTDDDSSANPESLWRISPLSSSLSSCQTFCRKSLHPPNSNPLRLPKRGDLCHTECNGYARGTLLKKEGEREREREREDTLGLEEVCRVGGRMGRVGFQVRKLLKKEEGVSPPLVCVHICTAECGVWAARVPSFVRVFYCVLYILFFLC